MNVILTGASRGIGYQIALALCRVEINHLVLISRNNKALEQLKKECEILAPLVNITLIAEDINILVAKEKRLLDSITTESIDLLINNAGLLINKPFEDFSIEEARSIFDINFHGPAQLVKILAPLLRKSDAPHVLNISSVGGFQGSSKYPGLSYYSSSKAALASLTECLAVEYADTKLKFNCLALGAVQTEMLEEAFPGYNAPLAAKEMGEYIADFAINGHKYYNGQILPVRLGNP